MTVMTETGAFDRLVRSLYGARNWLWLAFAVPAAVLAGLILVVLPPQQELANIGDWAFRLSPIVLAVIAVSVLPRTRFGPALFFLAIVFYMGVLDTGLVERIQQFGKDVATDENAFEPVYQFELLVVSFVTVFALLAYRMGGARTAVVLKAGIADVPRGDLRPERLHVLVHPHVLDRHEADPLHLGHPHDRVPGRPAHGVRRGRLRGRPPGTRGRRAVPAAVPLGRPGPGPSGLVDLPAARSR